MYPQRADTLLQRLDRCALTVEAISGPCCQIGALPNWNPPLVPFHQLWIHMIGKRHSVKADQSTLASGDSEHAWLFSVAISWGNKMNFSLYTEAYQVFAQTVIYINCHH